MSQRTLIDLLVALEAAEEGSQDLDEMIARHLDIGGSILPKWTRSVDAALELVLDGWAIENWIIWPGHPSTLNLLETERSKDGRFPHRHPMIGVRVKAPTPALALCIACLKARGISSRA